MKKILTKGEENPKCANCPALDIAAKGKKKSNR
jgi:hypothetical protein